MSVDRFSVAGRDTHSRHLASIKLMMGAHLCALMDDPQVTDINLNDDGGLWVTRFGQEDACEGFMDGHAAQTFIGAVAHTLGTTLTEDNPIVEGELITDGSRFEGVGRPLVESPTFSIRKLASAVFTLAEWQEKGLLTRSQRRAIESAILKRRNILVVGGTGTGKTTFVNAILAAIAELTPADRAVLIEDVRELQCSMKNKVRLRTLNYSLNEIKAGKTPLGIRDLLRVALRLFPKRILVGEVRGAEAFDLLNAWITGHPGGVSTLHADIATERGAITRLETMMFMAQGNPLQRLIAEAVGLIVCLNKGDDGIRRVTSLVSVDGFENNDYVLTPIKEEE